MNIRIFKGIWIFASPLCILSALFFYGKVVDQNSIVGKYYLENAFSFFCEYYYADRTITYILIYIVLVNFLHYTWRFLQKDLYIVIFALINALIFVLGKSFMQGDDLNLIILHNGQTCVALFALIGYFVVFYVLLCSAFYFFDNSKLNQLNIKSNKILFWIFELHPLIGCSCVLLMFWSPYIIFYYPGILHYDGYDQLKMYYGYSTWTTHHPVFSTLLMGRIMDFGKQIASDELGVFLYTFFQSLIFIFTISYSFKYMKEWKIPHKLRIAFLLFYGIVPIFPMYAYTEIKDTLSYIFSLWFVYVLIDIYKQKEIKGIRVPQLLLIIILLCLSRNEMKMVFFCILILTTILKKTISEQWLRFSAVVILGLFIAIFCNTFFVNRNNIQQGSIGEALSVPIQQTARYMRYHKEDISVEEYEILQMVFTETNLGDVYQPDRSDVVKAKFKTNNNLRELLLYGKLWTTQFFKHPGCYFSALFNFIYGYFYPEQPEYYVFGFSTNNITAEASNYIEDIDIQFCEKMDNYRTVLYKWMKLFNSSAITSFLFHPGLYGSIFIMILFFMLHYKLYENLLIYIFPLILLLVCCLSPLNSSIRYSLSIVCSLPVLLSSTVQQFINKHN